MSLFTRLFLLVSCHKSNSFYVIKRISLAFFFYIIINSFHFINPIIQCLCECLSTRYYIYTTHFAYNYPGNLSVQRAHKNEHILGLSVKRAIQRCELRCGDIKLNQAEKCKYSGNVFTEDRNVIAKSESGSE